MQKTILLVDDEPLILNALKRTLSGHDYKILMAKSGLEALDLLKKHPAQIVISDQRMPEMTGSELLCQVKKLYPDTVRIILSGYADFNAVQAAINEGAIFKFLNKPWETAELRKVVEDAFALVAEQIDRKQHRLASQEKDQQLLNVIDKDKLTGLDNRSFFYTKLTNTLLSEKVNPVAIVYIDIDAFGIINNSFGQETGDLVLNEYAKRVSAWVKDESYVARVGNDEFALTLMYQTNTELQSLLQDLHRLLKQPVILPHSTLHLTASIGISRYPEDSDKPDTLIHYAVLALQHCKKELGGDNYQLYAADLSKPEEEQIKLSEELYEALNKKQFVIYYQPVVDIRTGKIKGAEALVRWESPTRGLVQPSQFIHVCENTGLIVPVGAYVLNEACRQVKQWHGLGYPDLCIAVNLSARQFNHGDLIALVTTVLERYNLPPHCLELEITESLCMQSIESNVDLLKLLPALGLLLSLDDFGTGYSSLSYLKNLPFNTLKIDKSFVDDLEKNTSIVQAIITLAKSLGLTIVAEGVETKKQLKLLKKMHCDYFQGYLFSKPVPAQDFERLLLNSEMK